MLNSAVGVTLPPSKKPPPISTICLMRGAIFGSRISASAMLVSGPSAQSVIVPLPPAISVSTMKSTACCFCSGIFGSGRSRAVEAGLAMHLFGRDQLAHQRPDRAGKDLGLGPAGQFADLAGILLGQLQRHVAGDRGDAEDVQFGAAKASRMATASSCPGSVSMMIFAEACRLLSGGGSLAIVLNFGGGADHISIGGKNAIWVFPAMCRSKEDTVT